jgi:hypothetical protein
VSDRQKQELEKKLEQERWWPRPPGTISASLAVRGDEAPYQMRGSWAKWNRAVAHYHELRRTAATWLRDSWTIECEFDADLAGHVATFRTRDDELERLRIGTIAGDCFHNLRSALDFVMWELIHQHWRRTGTTPPTDERKLSGLPNFPLALNQETREQFESKVRKHPISERAMERIVEVHDFAQNGARPYLRGLRVLSNNDKHRVPLVATAAVNLPETAFVVESPDGDPETEYLFSVGDPFDDGTRFAIVRFKDAPRPEATVSVAKRPPSVLQLKYADGSGTIDIWTVTGVLLDIQDVLDGLQELFDHEEA